MLISDGKTYQSIDIKLTGKGKYIVKFRIFQCCNGGGGLNSHNFTMKNKSQKY